MLQGIGLHRIDELWLDHDLIGDDAVQPVVDHLVAAAGRGRPLDIGRILVHTANVRAAHRITTQLVAAGYPARPSFQTTMWRHQWPR